MARKASTSDFEVNVPTVGRYVFARRSVGDSFKIRGMYDQLTAGCYDEEGRMQDLAALGFCSVKVLAVEQPKDFHIESIDPLMDDGWDKKLLLVYAALVEKENSFRPRPTENSAKARKGDGEDVRPVASKDVQPRAD